MVEEDQGEKGEGPNLEAKEEGEGEGGTVYKEVIEVYHMVLVLREGRGGERRGERETKKKE